MSDRIECVYLIGCEVSTLVKIGRSIDVQWRLAALQAGSPVPLTLLWQTLGGAELEAALHRQFDSRRAHGEWFDFPEGDAVAQVTRALPEIVAEMQRVQREQMIQLAQRAKAEQAAIEAASSKPSKDTRVKAREYLREDPGLQAPDLADRLGKARNSGYIRQLRTELLAELTEAGEIPPVRAVGA